MARRRTSRRRGSNRRKSSGIVRKLLIGVALLIPVLWVVFTKVVFDPFETPVPAFRLLVPRDVDLYVQRESLASDFELTPGQTPVPTIVQRWMRTLQWRDLAATDWGIEHGMPVDAEELLAPVTELMSLDAGPVDIMQDLVGNELAVIGRNPWSIGHYAFLCRLTNTGKLAVEAFPKVALDAEGPLQGATHTEVIDDQVPDVRWFDLGLADGTTWSYQRVSDLLVVGNDSKLVRDVLRTVSGGSELSLGLSRLFRDNLTEPSRAPEERLSVELSLDVQNLVEAYDLDPDLEARNVDAVANVLPRLVDVTLMREAVGRLEVDKRQVDLDVLIDVATVSEGAQRGGLKGQKTFKAHERLTHGLSLMPVGTSFVQTMNVDLTRFLKSVVDGLDPELVKLLNDTIRDVQRYNPAWGVHNVSQLIAELDRALMGELTIGARRLDHDVPPGSQPVPTLAFLLPVRDLDAWEAIGKALINGNQVFGVNSTEMWQQEYGGLGVHKVLPLPATSAEALSFIVLDGEWLILTTDPDMTAEMIEAYGGGRAQLGEPDVRELISAFEVTDTRANAAVWMDTRGLRELLDPYADWHADLETQLDFSVLRAVKQRDILRAEFGGEDITTLSESDQQAIGKRLDDELDALEKERVERDVPAFASAWREGLGWMTLLQQAVGAVRIGDETLGVGLHLRTVVD